MSEKKVNVKPKTQKKAKANGEKAALREKAIALGKETLQKLYKTEGKSTRIITMELLGMKGEKPKIGTKEEARLARLSGSVCEALNYYGIETRKHGAAAEKKSKKAEKKANNHKPVEKK